MFFLFQNDTTEGEMSEVNDTKPILGAKPVKSYSAM